MVTPAHLIHSHGYSPDYANRQSPEEREAEHLRLHTDETAKHLDHTHTIEGEYVAKEAK